MTHSFFIGPGKEDELKCTTCHHMLCDSCWSDIQWLDDRQHLVIDSLSLFIDVLSKSDPAYLSPLVNQICPACFQPMKDENEHEIKNGSFINSPMVCKIGLK